MTHTKCIIDKNGTKRWRDDDDNLHREDGPASEHTNGSKFWYLHGKRHREGAPAMEYSNGDKYWILYDKLHREDGPAIEHTDGYKEWWLHGQQINCDTQEQFERLMNLKAFW